MVAQVFLERRAICHWLSRHFDRLTVEWKRNRFETQIKTDDFPQESCEKKLNVLIFSIMYYLEITWEI